jgi:molybdopterin/thiamine biosynthesis adenylyltransferase
MSEGLDRGARQPKLIDGPADLAARLSACIVAVIGAGSVGQRVIDSLARLGVGGLWICDPRNTKPESLLTHPISAAEIDLPKALLAARRARAISPQTDVRYFPGAFESMPMDALVGASQVLIATDNLAAEVSITQACMRLALPQIQASVYGPALVAQVRSLPGDGQGAGPCVACGYLARDWDDLNAGTRFSCEGSADAVPAPTARATMSFPHLCAIAAQLAVGELFRQLLALDLADESGVGSVLEYCGFHGGTTRTPLLRKRGCPIEHESWLVHCVEPGVTALTPRDLGRIAGSADLREVSIRVDHYSFVSHTACGCEVHPALGCFHAEGMPLGGPCPSCGDERVPHPLHTYREVPGGALADHLDRTLAELGVSAEPAVLVRGSHGATLIRSAAPQPIAQRGASAVPPLVCSGESSQAVAPQ